MDLLPVSLLPLLSFLAYSRHELGSQDIDQKKKDKGTNFG
jgi:hypothetical protein